MWTARRAHTVGMSDEQDRAEQLHADDLDDDLVESGGISVRGVDLVDSSDDPDVEDDEAALVAMLGDEGDHPAEIEAMHIISEREATTGFPED